MTSKLAIIGLLVDKRTESAPKLQEVLTKYGDSVLGRFGIHDPGEEDHGLITLNVRDKEERIHAFQKELQSVNGVEVKILDMK